MAHEYTPLHSIANANSRRRPRCLLFVLVAVVTCALVVALAWRTDTYTPLTHYQDLNPPPLVSPTNRTQRTAVISTLYSDSYALAAAVLAHSYQHHHPNHTARLLLPYLPGRISPPALCVVRAAGWQLIEVPFIPPPNHGKGIHHRFIDQYTKLNIWDLPDTHIDKAIYLDADTLVRAPFPELFDLPYTFAAVPDVYTDAARSFTIDFNAGVLVFTPSPDVLATMKRTLQSSEDSDTKARYPPAQAEQAFLNLFFAGTALRLPYAYNANLAIKRRSPALWASLSSPSSDNRARIVHYTLVKPFKDIPLRSLRGSSHAGAGASYDDDHARRVLSTLPASENGFWAEEVGWWARAFEDMMAGEVGRAVQACLREEDSGDDKVKEPIKRALPRSLGSLWRRKGRGGAPIPKQPETTTGLETATTVVVSETGVTITETNSTETTTTSPTPV
ncbi:hypothetical protein DXG03_003612 [Asterophora parasitica]|uniref:Glycosyltransferase family 8 protein n=1 Tax=Asterophora parasitica TaxID=117018 RepID=A0A9P7K9C7_9AGAR|nr:hypothetical protein DXG03_003612 [Asterophora parasitica]